MGQLIAKLESEWGIVEAWAENGVYHIHTEGPNGEDPREIGLGSGWAKQIGQAIVEYWYREDPQRKKLRPVR